MEPGNEERYVRCRRCHGVFEAGLPNCTRCGTPYVAPSADQAVQPDSYADKYQGSEFAPPEVPAPVPAPRRSPVGPVLVVGSVLLVVAVAASAMVMMGALDPAPRPTAPPIRIAAITPSPTPAATLPPAITRTLATLADPHLNMHISIKTNGSVNARANPDGRSTQIRLNIEADCANGDESGTDQTGSTSYEWRLVDGIFYLRTLPSGKWQLRSSYSPFFVLSPLFSLTETRQLQYLGPDMKNGVQTDKLESTQWWTPNAGKMSGMDVATLNISPQHTLLDLWVTADGSPVYATFRAWKDAADGTGVNLLDISTTYAFSNPGSIMPIPSPSMK